MFDNPISTPLQVSWNLSDKITFELATLLQRASNYYIARDYDSCFDCLVSVKNRAIQSFNKDEREEFDKQEEIILNYIKGTREESRINNQILYNKCRDIVYKKLKTYNLKLMDCLNKYGYLNPPKEDAKKMF